MRPVCCARLLGLLALFFFGPLVLSALTVVPTDFDRLIEQAEQIFRGTVVSATPRWEGEGKQRHIVTDYVFRVEESYRGRAAGQVTLRVFGGALEGRRQQIAGLPEFRPGETEILFVRGNGRDLCPLVGLFHGRLRVAKSGANGEERIHLHDGSALTDLNQVGRSSEKAKPALGAAPAALRPVELAERIRAALRARGIEPDPS